MIEKPKVPYATTLEVRDACLCLHVQRGARALARIFDDAFRPIGITHGQFSLLMSLNRPDPPTVSAIADFLGMDRTSLTAKLKPLERRGLVQLRNDQADRRNRRLSLTLAGSALLAEAIPIWRQTHKKVDGLVPLPGQKRIRTNMNALRASQKQ